MLDDTSCALNMESPQMYDLSDVVVKADFAALSGSLSVKNNKLDSAVYGDDFGELTDLGASEVSLDLQSFVADQQFSDAIFTDIIDQRSSLLTSSSPGVGGPPGLRPALPPISSCAGLNYVNSYLPPVSVAHQRPNNVSGLALKKEPDSTVFSPCRPSQLPGLNSVSPAGANFHSQIGGGVYSPTYATQASGGCALGQAGRAVPQAALIARSKTISQPTSSSSSSSSSSMKRQDRSTDEYRRRRERNNVAVRKSREKAKLRSMETEERVKYLSRENDGLQKRIDMLSKELNVLKNLFANVGMLPDQLQREINKHLSPTGPGASGSIGGLHGAAVL